MRSASSRPCRRDVAHDTSGQSYRRLCQFPCAATVPCPASSQWLFTAAAARVFTRNQAMWRAISRVQKREASVH